VDETAANERKPHQGGESRTFAATTELVAAQALWELSSYELLET
jgi:hypothetical protein